MKKYNLTTLAAILAMAANTYAADTPAASAAIPATASTQAITSDASKPDDNPMMADLEYSDAKECHIKMPDGMLDGDKPMSVIHALISERGLNHYDDAQLLIALGTAIAKGCDINEPDAAGLQPLNDAILFNDAEAVNMLLEKGADPYQVIHRPGSLSDGMNSFQFLDLLQETSRKKGPRLDYSEVAAVLQKYR